MARVEVTANTFLGGIGLVIVLLGVGVGLGVWFANLSKDAEDVRDSQQQVITTIKDAARNTQDGIGSVETSIGRIETSIDSLARAIGSQGKADHAIKGPGPATLTEYGKRISRAMNGEELANEIAPRVASKVNGWIPYDIQRFSFFYFRDKALEDAVFRTEVRNVAYEYSVSDLVVFAVLGIELRDKLLETDLE